MFKDLFRFVTICRNVEMRGCASLRSNNQNHFNKTCKNREKMERDNNLMNA